DEIPKTCLEHPVCSYHRRVSGLPWRSVRDLSDYIGQQLYRERLWLGSRESSLGADRGGSLARSADSNCISHSRAAVASRYTLSDPLLEVWPGRRHRGPGLACSSRWACLVRQLSLPARQAGMAEHPGKHRICNLGAGGV